MEEFFPFQNAKLTAGLELASDVNPSLLSQDRTTQLPLLHRDCLSEVTQAPKLKQGEESPETGKGRKTSFPRSQKTEMDLPDPVSESPSRPPVRS